VTFVAGLTRVRDVGTRALRELSARIWEQTACRVEITVL